jgi:hypothetical protein
VIRDSIPLLMGWVLWLGLMLYAAGCFDAPPKEQNILIRADYQNCLPVRPGPIRPAEKIRLYGERRADVA